MTTKTLAAVVVSFNRLEQLQKTVDALLAEPVDHIVIVDNASTDGSAEWLSKQNDPRLKLIALGENTGGAAGFERGMRYAMANHAPDWLVLMDEDARPQPGAITEFRKMEHGTYDVIAAAVTFPDGSICEMNRPWHNPFGSWRTFLRTTTGGGRDAFHISNSAFSQRSLQPIDGGSFVGLFVKASVTAQAGYPDGQLFIYGDDVLYTLGLSQDGYKVGFSGALQFTHECGTRTDAGVFQPLWKNYYRFRNLFFVYRLAAGPVLFWPIFVLMTLKWALLGLGLPPGKRATYFVLLRWSIIDALRKNKARKHTDILMRSNITT